MPRNKKNSKNVIFHNTFTKKKVKIGKTLKKTNVANTTVKSKAVVVLDQFSSGNAEPVSHRGLTLSTLVRQIGHPSASFRRDAVIGLKQLLTEHPELIELNLHDLSSTIGRLISDEKFASNKIDAGHLKALAKTVFTADEKIMSSSFGLFSTHLRIGFTHMKVSIRSMALEIGNMIFAKFPSLCRKDTELRDSFLTMMKSAKKSTSRPLLAESVRLFKDVYESPALDDDAKTFTYGPLFNIDGNVNEKNLNTFCNRLYFPIFYEVNTSTKTMGDISWLDQFL